MVAYDDKSNSCATVNPSPRVTYRLARAVSVRENQLLTNQSGKAIAHWQYRTGSTTVKLTR